MHFALLLGTFHGTAFAAWLWFGSALESFAQSAGSALVTSIWQGVAIVCALEVALRLMPRVSAAHRFAAWAAGFVLATGMPLLSLLHPFGQPAGAGSLADSGLAGSSPGALFQLDARWGWAIAALWVVASSIRVADLAAHSVRLRRLWKAARPVEVTESLAAAIRDLRGGRVAICTTEMLDRPSVIGFLAPRILIPNWLIARVTPGELEQIVLHEAEHLRRCDDWTNLFQKLYLVAFPLNPALAWIEHHLCREREMACDEGVVRITNAPRAYAACLTSLAERRLEKRAEALSLGAWHRRSELVDRVHRILLHRHGMNRAAAGTLLGAVGCMLIAGSVEMARCPQLVAFVRPQNSLTMTPARRQQLTAMLALENAESNIVLPSGFHAAPTKAVMPPAKPSTQTKAFRHETPKASNAHGKSAAPKPEQIARCDQSGDRVNPDLNEQWVVLAAWGEVQTLSRSPGPTADYDIEAQAVGQTAQNNQSTGSPAITGNTGKSKSAAKTQSNGSPNAGTTPDKYTITRLLLRVVPANSTSAEPPSMRGGWLIFQL
jgi:hypothetical protein